MEKAGDIADVELLTIADPAFERTMLAHQRNSMAWIRTSILLISLGFTLYKFFQEVYDGLEGHKGVLAARWAAMILIAFGLFALFLAQIQFHKATSKIKQVFPDVQESFSWLISVLVLVVGLIMFLLVLFKQ